MLKKGSKSFGLATLFFSAATRQSVYYLYAWCRHCDDVTDGSTLGFSQNPMGLETNRVQKLIEHTQLAIKNPQAPLERPFIAFAKVMNDHEIPWAYAQDLLEGMSRDARGDLISNASDLRLYCYQVAGTVGLMMCHIMGLKDPRALKNAVDLGIALQLTNITRDIGDDYRVGKIYLPMEWLQEAGIAPADLMHPKSAIPLETLVNRLLREAEVHYKSGLKGLSDLPWRPALAVAIAASVYRAIGIRVQKLGPLARHQRVSLSRFAKSLALLRGIFILMQTLPGRLFKPRTISPIREIWRYS
jgi:phytoene synthase